MSGRYERLEQDADDDSVALIMGLPPPRLAQFRSRGNNNVELDFLDENGEPMEDERFARTRKKLQNSVRQSSKNLVYIIVGVAFSLVTVGIMFSFRNRSMRMPPEYYKPVLTEPLDLGTQLSNGTHKFRRSTLMISLDGMHPHYISEKRTPFLHHFTEKGFITPYIKPAFPSQTFPNHWTLITGMHPVNHGIVGNTFYDPELKLEFKNTDPERSLDRRFWGGEPIWVTGKKHQLVSAVHMWPGSEAEWGEDAPDEVYKFNRSEPLDQKAKKIIEWFDKGTEMPQIMLSYVPNIDTVGHKFEFFGKELITELSKVDDFIQTIVEGLEARNLTDVVNLVIVSDHGMAPTSNERLVFLDDIIYNYNSVVSNRGWPLAGLRFNTTQDADDAYRSAMKSAKKTDFKGFKVYQSDNMPAEWYFTKGKLGTSHLKRRGEEDEDKDDSPTTGHEKPKLEYGRYRHRLAQMYVVPDVGYSLLTHKDWDEMNNNYFLKGVHGYNNSEPTMRALFLAQGPAFPKGNYRPFNNTDVYSAICRSVGVEPNPESDGDFIGRRLEGTLPYYENYPNIGMLLPHGTLNSTLSKFFKPS